LRFKSRAPVRVLIVIIRVRGVGVQVDQHGQRAFLRGGGVSGNAQLNDWSTRTDPTEKPPSVRKPASLSPAAGHSCVASIRGEHHAQYKQKTQLCSY
jgi:hypothetical protein